MIYCLNNSERGFSASHTLMKAKLHFRKEPHLSSIYFESVENHHFIYRVSQITQSVQLAMKQYPTLLFSKLDMFLVVNTQS